MIYPRLLGADFDKLAPVLREFHSGRSGGRARGIASVRHANRLLARVAGFPPVCDRLPTCLDVQADGDREVWVRMYGETPRRSVQYCERGLLVEEVGPVRLEFRVFVEGADLRMESSSVRWRSVPVPVRVRAVERANGAGWKFEVSVSGVGDYDGVMELA